MTPKTIDGFDIPYRELTREEASREITLERFQEWHQEVGEDFVDQHSYGNVKIFLKLARERYPQCSETLLEVANDKHRQPITIQDIQFILDELLEDEDGDKFYTLYAEYLNRTTFAKENVNRQLILVMEHYKS